jgi:hypothetical protein
MDGSSKSAKSAATADVIILFRIYPEAMAATISSTY